MSDELHPIARQAMRLALRPRAEAEERLADLAGDDLAALDTAHRDLCRRLAVRPYEPPAVEGLRLVHEVRNRLRRHSERDREALTSSQGELVGSAS